MSFTLLIAAAAMLWGSDLLLRPPVLAAGWSAARLVLWEHLLLSVAFALPLWRARRRLARLTGRQWGALVFVAWGGSALATWLYTTSFTLGQPLFSILLQKTQPLFALLLAGWILKERRAPGFWAWCLAALVGAFLLTGIHALPSVAAAEWCQAGCALAAAALWGAATVAGRGLTAVLPPPALAGARFVLALPPLLTLALLGGRGGGTGHTAPGSHPWLFLLLIVLLPDLLGMVCYYAGLRQTPASVATLAELCYPLTALILGIAVQHARLDTGQWAGLLLLVGSVLRLGARPSVAAAPPSALPALS